MLSSRAPGMLSRLPRSVASRSRQLSTSVPKRPHPLSSTPPPSVGGQAVKHAPQRWSTLTAVLLATLTGTTTYVVGLQSGGGAKGGETSNYKDPTRDAFDAAMIELRKVLPEDCVARDRDSLVAHGYSDWSFHEVEGLAGAVLYPRSTEDVVGIVKLATKHSIPIIPFSGGTSLEGQAEPIGYPSNPEQKLVNEKVAKGEKVTIDDVSPGLSWVIDFSEHMNQIIKINADDLDIVVQPGISYDAINAILKEDGIPLFFPVDPAPGAQIGGMVGTGASGTNAVRYGTMRENVLNLTIVLPNGEVIKTRQRAKKSSAGPDLTKLFVGSEGTLGLVVEATLKLSPLQPSQIGVSSFPSVEAAALAVRDIVQQGISVACVELLDDVMIAAINKKGGGIVWDEKPSLFLKFSGTESQIKGDIESTRKIVNARKGSKFVFSRNDKEAEEIWYARKVALWSAIDSVEGAKCWVTDVCVPISNFPQLVAETKEDLAKEGINGPIVGHAGDGNFHALLLYTSDEEYQKVKGLVERLVYRAQRLDGTCTGEHGVGIGKIGHLQDELGKGTVDLLRSIKLLIDPQNVFNPGKLIPGALAGRKEGH